MLILGVVAADQPRNFPREPMFLLLYPVVFGLCLWTVVRVTRRRIPKGGFTPAKQVAGAAVVVLITSMALTISGAVIPFIGLFLTVAYLVLLPSLGVLIAWFLIALIRGRGWTGAGHTGGVTEEDQ